MNLSKLSMAIEVLLFFCFLTIFVHRVAAQQTNNTLSVGASLTAAPDAKPWLSPSGEFALGFQQQPQGNDSFLLSIWYDKIPDKTIIWYPKDGPMVPRGSKAELIDRRGLVLSDPQGREVWSSSGSILDNLAYGLMNDTGNFQLVGSNYSSTSIWESFDHPADTMLPAQIIGRGGEMDSKMSRTNFSSGRFQLRLLTDGNLVLNSVDMFSGSADDAYYASNTNDVSNSTNSGYQLIFDVTGYLYILRENGQRFDLTTRGSLPSGDYYHRATLDSDGIFTQYYYPKNPSSRNTSWEEIKIVPPNFDNICDTGKACGLNNICSLEGNRPKCECPQGFSLYDINSPNGDCAPGFSPSCDEGYGGEEQFELIELSNVNWPGSGPGSDYVHLNPINEQDCKTSCLKDCFCAVALHRDINCWKKKLPLSAGRKVPSDAIKTFFKVRKSSDRPSSGNSPVVLSRESKNRASLILVGAALCVVTIVLIVVIGVGFFRVYNQKASTHPYRSISEAIETTLPRFKYQELVNATNGFNDELGQGAFGVVYKGVIGTKPVAVKKLYPVVQNNAQKEFKTEVNTIARTHHKNLVQLLGYCDDGEQRLLIYEFMSNGTLAFYLFGDRRPSWNQRSNIAVGIARGLSYLHEECSAQIIHCDIKPQNILLDDCYNAKIADFGLAKLLKINESRTHTGIRGTKGYVAPEWFRNTPVSVKVDVYSFGVLLLEIISCRRSVIFESDNEFEILADLAWDFYHEGRLDAFVKNDLEAINDYKKLATFVMVGLWCIQENPSLRPTMKKVVQMLEGECGVTEPPCPSPLYVTSC